MKKKKEEWLVEESADQQLGGISRRNFLNATAATAVGAIGLVALPALTACNSTTDEGSTTSSEAAAGTPEELDEFTWGSIVNPQEKLDAATTDFSAIFSPLQIAHKTLPNRLCKSCAGSELQSSNDWPDEAALSFYEEFCKGGIAMIDYEPSTVSALPGMGGDPTEGMLDMEGGATEPTADMGMSSPVGLNISTDEGIPAHKAIADLVHKYDVVLIAQMYNLMSATGAASSQTIPESALETSLVTPIMQSIEDIHATQRDFIDAAGRYKKAGFDGIELNCSCNHYFSTFLSRYANNERTDEYGAATLENRARVVTEIIEGIRKEVGEDFIIQVLYSGIETNIAELGGDDLCITMEEGIEFAKIFEKAGASSLHIRAQLYGHHNAGFHPDILHFHEHGDTGYGTVIDYNRHAQGMINGSYHGAGALIEVAAKIKSAVSIPVGAVGYMDPRTSPDLMNNAIADGKIDFILMTRPLMADPHIARKLEEGRRDEVAPCTRCMTCFVAPFDFGVPMYCRVNPALTRALTEEMPEGFDPTPAATTKEIMVIGGGPAGMEAAQIAARRGHTVSLYERNKVFGGLTNLAARIKGPHERIADFNAYLVRMMEVNGVKVTVDTEVDLDLVKSEDPDVVVVAVGGLFDSLSDSADSGDNVISMGDLYNELISDQDLDEFSVVKGDHIVMYGARLEACGVIEYLVKRGKRVTVLNPGPESEIYMGAPTWPRMMGRVWLRKTGVKFYNNVKLDTINAGSVSFITEYGISMDLPYDQIIDGRPMLANLELFDSIKDAGFDVRAVGDCYAPGPIVNAVARANLVARKIEFPEASIVDELAPNQYAATAVGIGDVLVVITVEDGKIIDALVDTSNETEGIGRGLGVQFTNQIISTGDFDAVSGATLTSTAAREALASARERAGI